MVRMNAQNSNPDGATGLPPGAYHVVVDEAGIDPKNQGKLRITFMCLAGRTQNGDTQGCVNVKHTEFFDIKDEPGCINRLFQAAYALGYLTLDQWKAMREAKVTQDIPLEHSKGRQCCIEIRANPGKEGTKNEGKIFYNVDYRMWPLSDPKTEAIPKDPAWVARAGGMAVAQAPVAHQAPPPGYPPQQPAYQSPPPASPPPPAGTNDYSQF